MLSRLLTTALAAMLAVSCTAAPAQAAQTTRWDPCAQPITWSVATNPGDHRTVRTMRRVTAEITSMTGLTFAPVPAGGQIAVRYRTPYTDDFLTGADAYELSDLALNYYWIVGGHITIDTRFRRTRRTGDRLRLIRHEMGHAMGLAHSDDPAAVMAPAPVATAWTDTDRAASTSVAASLGCTPPEPEPVPPGIRP